MKYSAYLSALALTLLVAACYEEPEFPLEPKIEFKQVRFYDDFVGEGQSVPSDFLAITVSYQDGDGNIGLRSNFIEPPFHEYSFFSYPSGELLLYGDSDTLPPINCTNYLRGVYNDTSFQFTEDALGTDYLYIQRNPFHNNFFLDFYKVVDGEEIYFDFLEARPGGTCGTTPNGRFPLELEQEDKPISGTITYNFTSSGLIPYFGNDSIKVKVRIADRALNLSNVAESPVFTLRSVQAN